jgi:hypothetical protein
MIRQTGQFGGDTEYSDHGSFWFPCVPSGKYRDSIWNQATTASVQILSNLLFKKHPPVRRHTAHDTDGVVKQTKKKIAKCETKDKHNLHRRHGQVGSFAFRGCWAEILFRRAANITEMYCGFHRPPLRRKWGYSASNSATTTSFHDPSNWLVTNHPTIKRYISFRCGQCP